MAMTYDIDIYTNVKIIQQESVSVYNFAFFIINGNKMNNFEENTCRICLQNKDTLFSLFRKIKGSSPYEKLLNKTKLQLNVVWGPSSICSQCLMELDTTVNFLDKCEKSNAILAAKSPEIVEHLNSVSEHHVDEEEISDLNGESKEAPIEVDTAKCPECGSLRRCKHWAPLKTLICNFCQKAFTRKFNLKLHLKRHLGEKDWPCPKCGIRQLTQWLARRHCGPRPRRPCPVAGCDKSFTTNTNLNSHIRTHYGQRIRREAVHVPGVRAAVRDEQARGPPASTRGRGAQGARMRFVRAFVRDSPCARVALADPRSPRARSSLPSLPRRISAPAVT
ncbi:unnamed protein product [Chilo suppressalis]|uniref:C2H2-type domain-containing protein n=1 Tax=Chilo suppressalis TaxID=168631 RepID=A0ABN8AV56_CHISP|nr:unnamed protein product [Chilo suppressalis]